MISTIGNQERFKPDLTLRSDFDDDERWKDLARKFYIRLPLFGTHPTNEKKMRWLRKFRVSEKDYLEMTGFAKLSDFERINLNWPLRAFVGLLLEHVNQRDDARHVLKAYDR